MIATLGIIQSSRIIPANLLLDTYTGAAAAYSLRKLRTAYSGSAIRVRRSSDNTEQDIGFDGNGNLDESALTTFVGANSGYVTKWYDQSGNARDATQTTSANQPRIVNAGTVEKQNTKAALNYYSTTSLRTTFSYNSTQPFHIFQLFKNTKSLVSNVSYIFDFDNGVLQRPAMFYDTVSNGGLAIFAGWVLSANDSTSKNVINSTLFNNSNSNIYINNSQSASGLSGNNSPVGYYVIGDRYTNSGYNFQGYFSEIVIYLSDKSSNRAGIESNINSYYSIY